MKRIFLVIFFSISCSLDIPEDADENSKNKEYIQTFTDCEGPFSDDSTTVEQKILALQGNDTSERGCVNLSGVDFNDHISEEIQDEGLLVDVFELKSSASLYGISSLASLNFDNVYLSDAVFPISMELVWCDFSGTKGLVAEQFNYNENTFADMPARLNYIKFPDSFDVTNLDTENREMIKVDYSNTVGLTSSHLNKSSNFKESILPDNMDVSGLDLQDRNIQGIDFSKTQGLTWQQLDSVGYHNGTAFDYVILPNIDLSGWVDMSKHRFRWTDFSRTNVTETQLNTASGLQSIILP